jgi:hypothetical protein
MSMSSWLLSFKSIVNVNRIEYEVRGPFRQLEKKNAQRTGVPVVIFLDLPVVLLPCSKSWSVCVFVYLTTEVKWRKAL